MDSYYVIGLMSGTSLDGVDIALCKFIYDKRWEYEIIDAVTIEYPEYWENRLSNLAELQGESLALTNIEYGRYLGEIVNDFISKNNISVDIISSHGHTVFHQPEKQLTLQIGDGRSIHVATGLPVIYDYRSLDVALGGQGAPLVPIGDMLLFHEYDFCLNLGGIANISFCEKGLRIAFDICPANMVLNYYARQAGQIFDSYGKMASLGTIDKSLFKQLNELLFYDQSPPKSLGKEWVDEEVFPLINRYKLSVHDTLRTFSEHIAFQISKSIAHLPKGKMLITGGGAYNKFLIERIEELTNHKTYLPGESLINYKEALVFAFLGVLRWRQEINCLASVTGAARDSSTGIIIK